MDCIRRLRIQGSVLTSGIVSFMTLLTAALKLNLILYIGAGIGGAVGANAPTQKIVWGHCPHTLPSSFYKHIKYVYIVRFVNSYQQLSPISVETAFA